MNSFIFNMPTRVLFGAGQLSHLHEEKLPGKKTLIVTSNGQSTKKYGYLARVEAELDQAGWNTPCLMKSGRTPLKRMLWTVQMR